MLRLFGALLGVLSILFASASGPAHAGIDDCFKALAPIEQGAKAAEIAAKAGGCSAAATGDPVMAMTVAALTAAAAAGEFSTIAECNKAVEGTVGKLIAMALLELPIGSDAKKLLQEYMKGNLPVKLTDLVAAIPGLNALPYYIQCGCNVAGAPGEFSKLANDYSKSVKQCVNFAADAAKAIGGAITSAGNYIAKSVHSGSPGESHVPTCHAVVLPDNVWTSAVIKPGPAPTFLLYDPNCPSYHCAAGHYIWESGGQRKCVAACPEEKTFQPGGQCYSWSKWEPQNGVCKAGGSAGYQCCELGQVVFQWGVCSPACSDGIQYFDTNRKRCTACQTGWYPVYQSSQSSVGKCEECPWGHTYNWSSKKCVPLNCGIGYVNPRSPHTCAVCPPGQIYSAQTKACECTAGAIKTAGGCACPAGASKILSSATFTCACPEGSSLNKAKSACVCKSGHSIQAVNVGGSIITSCVPNKRAPVQSVRPTAPSTRCPEGTQLIGEACAPIVRRPVQQLPPCPRGTVSTPSGCAPPTRGPAIAQPPAYPGPVPSMRVPQQRQPSSPRAPVPRSEPFGPSIMVPR